MRSEAIAGSATCPMCHTASATLTERAVEAGGVWRCARCGQHWGAARLAAVAAYAEWTGIHDRIDEAGAADPARRLDA